MDQPIPATREGLKAGLHFGVPAERYRLDPAVAPSLSASIASLIVARSELHAWHAHPRLNPAWKPREPTADMEDGTALHTLLLGTGSEIVRVGSDDWKQEWAREKRARVRADGGVPVLARRIPLLVDCATAVREQLKDHPGCPGLFGNGNAEVTAIFRTKGVLCRSRVDWLCEDPKLPLYDLKFTHGSAAPEEWDRHVWETYALQAELYLRGIAVLRKARPPGIRFVVCEMDPPFGVSVLAPAQDAMQRAKGLLDDALERWALALKTRTWPGYRRGIAFVELPGWMTARTEAAAWEREQRRLQRPTLEQIEHSREMSERLGGPLA